MEGLHIPKEIFRYLKRFEYPHLVICQKKKKKNLTLRLYLQEFC